MDLFHIGHFAYTLYVTQTMLGHKTQVDQSRSGHKKLDKKCWPYVRWTQKMVIFRVDIVTMNLTAVHRGNQ